MADIELVIKIPEEIYQRYKKVWQKRRGSIPESCIAFGIPLPKGHGKIIDADELRNKFPIWIENFSYDVVNTLLSQAHPIIEPDKEN